MLFIILTSTTACATKPIIAVAPSDFPQSESGHQNSNSKYKTDVYSEMQIVSSDVQEVTNASGITYSPIEKLVYVITNNNNELHIYESANVIPSRALRTVQLKGWNESGIKNDQDLEDIVYLGETSQGVAEFALVNEGNPDSGAEVYICAVSAKMTELIRRDCDRLHVDVPIAKKNRGPEGITYDAQTKTFFIAVEGNEKGKDLSISEFKRPESKEFKKDPTGAKGFVELTPTPLFNSEKVIGELCPDFSGLVFSSKNRRLYLLSHVGERAVDIDLKGNIYGQFPLPKGQQFEGIALDADDNLLFISEPNLIYKFPRQP